MGDGVRLNRSAYERLIAEDIAWLDQQPRTLERDHIRLVLEVSPDREYGQPAPEHPAVAPGWEAAYNREQVGRSEREKAQTIPRLAYRMGYEAAQRERAGQPAQEHPAVAVLRMVEWAGRDWLAHADYCLVCHALKQDGQHRDGCALARVLGVVK